MLRSVLLPSVLRLTLGEKLDCIRGECCVNAIQIWRLSYFSLFNWQTNMVFIPKINRIMIHLLRWQDKYNSQETCRRKPKHSKLTKRERRAIKTLINNYLVEERAFYFLNERFFSNITGDIIFSTRSSERLISQATCRRVPKHRNFKT